jgi:hypothetical protein
MLEVSRLRLLDTPPTKEAKGVSVEFVLQGAHTGAVRAASLLYRGGATVTRIC